MWNHFWNDYLTMKDLYKKSAIITTIIYGILTIGLVVLTKWDDIKSIFGKVIPKKEYASGTIPDDEFTTE